MNNILDNINSKNNKTQIFFCKNRCCTIHIDDYRNNNYDDEKIKYNKYNNNNNKKAGMLIFDPITNKILLVQSNHNLWGPPKGSIEKNETDYDCAFREVYEETGLIIKPSEIKNYSYVQNCSLYLYVERNISNIDIHSYIGNDVNGYTWIKPKCLEELIDSGNIGLNLHCKLILRNFLNLNFYYPTFLKIPKHNNNTKLKKIYD
jgi:8-oxo-dGTP pyrophosphatase MutT (NUDIX family)